MALDNNTDITQIYVISTINVCGGQKKKEENDHIFKVGVV